MEVTSVSAHPEGLGWNAKESMRHVAMVRISVSMVENVFLGSRMCTGTSNTIATAETPLYLAKALLGSFAKQKLLISAEVPPSMAMCSAPTGARYVLTPDSLVSTNDSNRTGEQG